ncbi:MAG TPA: zinc-dependent alcohol dehydrogenase family protein [Thermoanaerobaculia bacterium]|nr:zinc-dependent alcohol dehydrogenase family protein [Thermoanaerobaculia bacterium]
MAAMVLEAAGRPLVERRLPVPRPGPGQAAIRVGACGVCRTDLHIVDGELNEPRLPLVLGHQIVGRVEELGDGVEGLEVGDRIGVPWLGWTCGECSFCRSGRENLCDDALFTGYQLPGGFAERTVADARYCFALPPELSDAQAAPLLCAGLIGYRTLRLAGEGDGAVGIYGFGAAAHLVAQVLRHQGRRFYAFTRPGDAAGQRRARELGAAWAGGSDQASPEPLAAALIFAPAGALVPKALRDVARGGVVVCGGIHMSDIPSFPYRDLWGERAIRSVANLTRRDGVELIALAGEIPILPEVAEYPLAEADRALEDLRAGRVEGAAVLVVE